MLWWVVAAAMVFAANAPRDTSTAVVFTLHASEAGDPSLIVPVYVGSNAQAYRWQLSFSQSGLFVADADAKCVDDKTKGPCHQLPQSGYSYSSSNSLTFSKQNKFNQGPFKGRWARDKLTADRHVYHDFPFAVLSQLPSNFVPAFGLGPAATAGKNKYPGPSVSDNNTVLGNLKQRSVISRQMFSLSRVKDPNTDRSSSANWTLILGGVDMSRARSSFVRLPLEVSDDLYSVLNGVNINGTDVLAKAYKLSLCYQCRSHWPIDAYSAVVAALSRYTDLASDGSFACADVANVTMELDFGGTRMPLLLSSVFSTDDPRTCQVRLDSSSSTIALGLSVWRYFITVIDYETSMFAVAPTKFGNGSEDIASNIPSLISGTVPVVKGFEPGARRESTAHVRCIPSVVPWLLLVVLLVS